MEHNGPQRIKIVPGTHAWGGELTGSWHLKRTGHLSPSQEEIPHSSDSLNYLAVMRGTNLGYGAFHLLLKPKLDGKPEDGLGVGRVPGPLYLLLFQTRPH